MEKSVDYMMHICSYFADDGADVGGEECGSVVPATRDEPNTRGDHEELLHQRELLQQEGLGLAQGEGGDRNVSCRVVVPMRRPNELTQ